MEFYPARYGSWSFNNITIDNFHTLCIQFFLLIQKMKKQITSNVKDVHHSDVRFFYR